MKELLPEVAPVHTDIVAVHLLGLLGSLYSFSLRHGPYICVCVYYINSCALTTSLSKTYYRTVLRDHNRIKESTVAS